MGSTPEVSRCISSVSGRYGVAHIAVGKRKSRKRVIKTVAVTTSLGLCGRRAEADKVVGKKGMVTEWSRDQNRKGHEWFG